MTDKEWDSDRKYHESLISDSASATNHQLNVHQIEIQTTPLFSGEVLACVKRPRPNIPPTMDVLPSYSFLAKILDTFAGRDQRSMDDFQSPNSDASGGKIHPSNQSCPKTIRDSRLFVNMNAPWSAFICGSQGSGKSHTLSCMLEAALKSSRLGPLPRSLCGMVFHYDKFTGFAASQICEAASLASTGVPVTILVSSSNFHRMERMYENKLNLPPEASKPVVAPLLLEEKQLNIERMMKLMAVDEKEGKISLYMEVSDGIELCHWDIALTTKQSVCRILRSMAMKNKHSEGLNYQNFKDKLLPENFNETQRAMLNTRLQLLESFMFPRKGIKWLNKEDAQEREKIKKEGIWKFKPGSLTIVDLSCPFVDESAACAMFNICLAIFLEDREETSRIVALDEAHKVRNMPSKMHDTDPFLVYDRNRLERSLHRESPIGDPPAAPFSYPGHHCNPGTHNIAQASGPKFDDNSAPLYLDSVV